MSISGRRTMERGVTLVRTVVWKSRPVVPGEVIEVPEDR
jgi:hypothetical protein